MPTTLTPVQLNAALTSEQIGEARTRSLLPIPDGETPTNPVAEEIAAACAKVDTYTAGWIIPAPLATGYARDIAAFQVAKRLGKPTEDQQKAYDRALKELEDIRDGKFPNLVRDTTTTATGKVRGGTRPNILKPTPSTITSS